MFTGFVWAILQSPKKVSPVSADSSLGTPVLPSASLFPWNIQLPFLLIFRISPRWTSLQFFSFVLFDLKQSYFTLTRCQSCSDRGKKCLSNDISLLSHIDWSQATKKSTWGGAHSSIEVSGCPQSQTREKRTTPGVRSSFSLEPTSHRQSQQSGKDIDGTDVGIDRQAAWFWSRGAWLVPSICASCVRARICSFRLPHQMPVWEKKWRECLSHVKFIRLDFYWACRPRLDHVLWNTQWPAGAQSRKECTGSQKVSSQIVRTSFFEKTELFIWVFFFFFFLRFQV